MNALTSQTILIYDVVKDTKLWYIYWFEDADILGVTDFGRQLYALQLDKDGRKKFMGNMTEKMLKPQWDKIFVERKFKIIKIDRESVQLMFAPKRELELQRIKDENERITAIQKCIQAYIKINCSLPKQNPTETGQNKRVAPNEENDFVENEKQVQPRKARRIPGQIQQAPITFDDDPSETDKLPDSNGKNISPMKS